MSLPIAQKPCSSGKVVKMISYYICGGRALIIALGITMLVLMMASGAGAATLTVNASSGADYTRIQDAINAASAGDTILVYSSTYFENVNVSKQLTLLGVDTGGGAPVVDAGGIRDTINITADGVILDGFNVRNSGKIWGPSQSDSGLRVHSNNNIIKNNNVSDSFAGINIGYFSINNTLNGNNVYDNFFGISIGYSTKNTLQNNVMKNNKYNFGLGGRSDSAFDNQINTSNIANGKPVYYIINSSNTIYDSSTNASTFYCINCVNVTIKDINLNENGWGIFFWNTTHSRIQNVNASNNSAEGIRLFYSTDNVISNNIANFNGWDGIGVAFSNNINVENNTANSNFGDGIELKNSSNSKVENNSANHNMGFLSYGSNYSPPTAGIKILGSNNVVKNNNASFNNIGINVSSGGPDGDIISYNNIIENNTVLNNSIPGFNGSDIITGGILIVGSSFDILKNNHLSNNSIGLMLLNNSSYNDISNNTVYKNSGYGGHGDVLGWGIGIMESSNNNIISSNNISENWYGVILLNSSYNNISNNTVDNNTGFISNRSDGPPSSTGILLIGSHNIIRNNNASNNFYGISVFSGGPDGSIISVNNTIEGNTVINNTGIAGENQPPSSGILLGESNSNIIRNNTLNENRNNGMQLYNSSNNLIYHNNLINNFINAYDNSLNNSWDNGYPSGGNFWSDYSGTDSNSDGIGDTPYNISGGAGAQDRYPFTQMHGWLGASVLRGDINRNSRLDTGDATLILRSIVGLTVPSQYLPILPTGDMNCNGRIDTGDATLILRDVVGLPIPRCWE